MATPLYLVEQAPLRTRFPMSNMFPIFAAFQTFWVHLILSWLYLISTCWGNTPQYTFSTDCIIRVNHFKNTVLIMFTVTPCRLLGPTWKYCARWGQIPSQFIWVYSCNLSTVQLPTGLSGALVKCLAQGCEVWVQYPCWLQMAFACFYHSCGWWGRWCMKSSELDEH